MPRLAKQLKCSEAEREVLRKISNSQTQELRMVRRAKMVFACAEGKKVKDIAEQMRERPNTVILWRERYIDKGIGGTSRRERCPRFGDMLQIDGSYHDWFNNNKKCNLINLIDDATGENIDLFSEAETTEAAVRILWIWICKYGVPRSIYADRKSLYFSPNHPQSKSIFAQFCDRLNIILIPAGSPQAKGRVERSNRTHQDRLIKKMAVRGIKNIDDANAYMDKYLQQHNSKFTVPPTSKENAHREKPDLSLNELCYIETERKIANDWTIKYQGHILQITKQSNCPPAKTFVTVRESLDKIITIFYRGYKVNYCCVDSPPSYDISTLVNCDISTLV